MKVVSRVALLGIFSVMAMLPGSNLFAQREIQDRAAVIVAVESVDDLLGDVSHLVGVAGFPEIVPFITFGAGEYVMGIDKSKPAGAYVTFDGERPVVVGFVPVTDLEKVLDTLSDQGLEIEEDGNYRLITTPDGQEVVAIEKGGWAYVSDDKANLDNLPGDPSPAVSDLADTYLIAARANIQNIPQSLKDQAIEAMKEGFESAQENAGDMTALQKKFNDMSINNFVDLVKESESIMMGLGVDKDGKKTFFDFEMTAKEGSRFAERIAAAGKVNASFTNFRREGAAINLHMASGMIQEDIDNYSELIAEGREEIIEEATSADALSDSEREAAKDIMGKLLDVVDATLKSGKLDLAGSVMLGDTVDVIAAGHVVDGAKLATSIEEALDLAEKKLDEGGNREGVEIARNVETFKGVKFHTITVPAPDEGSSESEAMKNAFGDKIVSVIGIGPDAVYLGVGEPSLASIKKAMGGQGTGVDDTVQFEISIAEFVNFARSVNTDENAAEMIGALSKSLAETGNDKIVGYSTYEGNTMKSSFQMGDGLIRLIGVGVQQFQNAFGGGGPGGGLEDF